MYYHMRAGNFIEADSFQEAKEIAIHLLNEETEDRSRWTRCMCLGLSHKFDCHLHPSKTGEIPY